MSERTLQMAEMLEMLPENDQHLKLSENLFLHGIPILQNSLPKSGKNWKKQKTILNISATMKLTGIDEYAQSNKCNTTGRL